MTSTAKLAHRNDFPDHEHHDERTEQHMTRTDILAELYSLPPAEVRRWTPVVQDVLYRNAVRRGWLMNDPTQP